MLENEGDTDVDAIGQYDLKGPVARRRIGAMWDCEPPDAEWPACRAAAARGQADFDAYLSAAAWLPAEAKALYASLPPLFRARVRQGALGLA